MYYQVKNGRQLRSLLSVKNAVKTLYLLVWVALTCCCSGQTPDSNKVTCPILFWIYWGHCWKDNSIFCDGDCKELAHRHCTGLSKACFLSASTLSWAFCPQCLLANQSKEILCLKEPVESLAAEVSILKTQVENSNNSATQKSQVSVPRDASSVSLHLAPTFQPHSERSDKISSIATDHAAWRFGMY